jgi:N-hydroxyarylamine O-acetyltransferase
VFDGIYTPKLHEVILVEADGGTYLCDVGYGNDGIAAPLLLTASGEQKQFANTYSFAWDNDFGHILRRKSGGDFISMYAFTDSPYFPGDFEVANHYSSTHPQSFFLQQMFVTKPTQTGRITLTEQHLKITDNDAVTERELSDASEFSTLLRHYFALDL